jgi:hypothetical protein
MNIVVFGWYHHRNAGDDRIQYCISRWFDGHTLAFLPAGRPPSVDLLRTYDAAIIGGGGLILTDGGVFRNMARWVRAAGLPVALVGVSSERLTTRLRQELREFLDVCCLAWFRDQGSLAAVGPHPRAFVAPDITWLYPFPWLTGGDHAVAVCLRSRATLPVDAWRTVLAGLDRKVVPWPLYFELGGDADLLRRLLPGATVPEEFSLDPLGEAATVVTSRYHGVVFALQAGRPAIAAGDAPKTQRFLAEHGLDQWGLPDGSPSALQRALDDLDRRRSSVMTRVAELRAMLRTDACRSAETAQERLLDAARRFRSRGVWRARARRLLSLGAP